MSEKRRDVLFSIVLIILSGAVFFSLGFAVARQYGFTQTKVVWDSVSLDTTTTKTLAFQGQIDINTATVEDLMQIEGIGEKTAQSIIDYRTKIGRFQYVEQLLYIEGIGETKYNKWSPYLTVAGADGTTISTSTNSTTSAIPSKTTLTPTPIGKFHLNSVTLEELMSIDGVGEKIAQSILHYRDEIGGFTSLEQLMDIDGIGEKRFAALCECLTLDD